MLNWYRSIFRENIRASFRGSIDLPRVTVPTLMLWGMRDIALGHEMAQPSIALCDEGELVFFENASHWLQHDEPEQVNARLLAFFASPA
jgi:pimeloyl-ACP methyl ester carboxylesterase